MLIDLFVLLRSRGLPVTLTELLTLHDALRQGHDQQNLQRFYVIARSLLVKRVEHYDLWDQAFAEFFHDRPFSLVEPEALTQEVLDWLQDPKAMRELTDEERAALEVMRAEELRRMLQERLREQTERHDGGSKWVGTGGTSPFGHGGKNPSGVKIGGSPEARGGGGAVQMAMARNFRNLRSDMTLDVRQIGVALRKLRLLARDGQRHELDIERTVRETSDNAGDLELVFQAPRKNRVKLLLLMDVGGSMTPYSRLCSQLFSAAHQATHFKQFESYYFHNCPYGVLYKSISQREYVATEEVLREVDDSWRCVIVGDAAMAPDELMHAGGSIDLYTINQRSGLSWLKEIKERVPMSVWLNPDPLNYWEVTYTVRTIRAIFEMYPLTLEGLDEAVATLRRRHSSAA